MNSGGATDGVPILIVDTDELLCNGLREALRQHPSVEWVAVARSVGEALATATRMAPAIVITELQLGEQGAVELLQGIREARCDARVLLLTNESNEACVRQVMMAGAWGYLLKDDGYAELLQALAAVRSGQRYFSNSVESRILEQYAERV